MSIGRRGEVRSLLPHGVDAASPSVQKSSEDHMMGDDKRAEDRERSLSKHILPSSGTMIGVCATLIGLVKLAEVHIGPSRVDEYTALASMLFLVSAIASYMSIRHADRRETSERCEMIADRCFLAGLIGLAAITLFFAYEVI
jgi:hypothetical protein